MDDEPAPIPAKDRAYAHVKERLLNGQISGGELLSEGEVAGELQMSRTPVREAFLLLEAEGFMRLFPKRGALVVAVSGDEVRDVMETRLLVERFAVERVAQQAGNGIADVLQDIVDEQRASLMDGRLAAFADEDRRMHHEIVKAAGNAILTRLHDSLRDRQRRMGTEALHRDPRIADRFLEEHEAIVEAIRRRDPEAATALLVAHLEGARAGLEAALPLAPLS